MAKLSARHNIQEFDCGVAALNDFLRLHALQSQGANAAQTYLAAIDEKVCGYFTLTVGSVSHDLAPDRLTKGLARHAVPVMILARLAVDRSWSGKGLGSALLKDALRRTAAAADIAGIRAIIVHAKDETARSFYRHFDFTEFDQNPYHLFLLMKQVRQFGL